MIDRLGHILASAFSDHDPEHLAEAVLLTAREVGPADNESLVVPAPNEPDAASTAPLANPPTTPAAPARLALPVDNPNSPSGRVTPVTEVGLRLTRTASPSLTTAAAFSRFRRVHQPGTPVINVDATVEATADAGRLVVVTRPSHARGLDVAIIVDPTPVALAWADTITELEGTLRRTGAFRAITRWTLERSNAAEPRIRDSAGMPHHVGQLVDPAGRRLVLVLTDATSDDWRNAGAWQALHRWAWAMPTALLHLLPPSHWGYTATGQPTSVVRSLRPARPNAALEVKMAWWSDDVTAEDVTVPVLGLDPDAIGRWSQSVVSGSAWTEAVWARPPATLADPSPSLSADDRLAAFEMRASEGAQRLARLLAGAPILSLPLIRVLHQHLVATPETSQIAELLVSGLLERLPEDSSLLLRFRPGVAELLYRGTTITQEWDLFDLLTGYLERNAGTGDEVRALIADPESAQTVGSDLVPFAAMGRGMAGRLGLSLDLGKAGFTGVSSNGTAGVTRRLTPKLALNENETSVRDAESQSTLANHEYDFLDLAEQQINDAVSSACEDLLHREIGHEDGDFSAILSWSEGGASIASIEPDLDTIVWETTDYLDGETALGLIDVEAEITFDGYVDKGLTHSLNVTIVDPDWDDRYALVAFTTDRPWKLRWSYRRDPGEPLSLEFDGVVEPDLNPHSSGAPESMGPLPADPKQRIEQSLLAEDPTGYRSGWAIRRAFDNVYDGPSTGKYSYAQLSSPQKTRLGTKVTAEIAREFDFRDVGDNLYRWHGSEFTVVFSATGRRWLLPWSTKARVHLLITADDTRATFNIGILQVGHDQLKAPNRDRKSALSTEAAHQIRWLYRDVSLPLNVLATMPETDAVAIISNRSSSAGLAQLFRRAPQQQVSGVVVATVVGQADPLRRVRDARNLLRHEGIVVVGAPQDSRVLQALGLELPAHWWMSIRVAPARDDDRTQRRVAIDGRWWRVAQPNEPIVEAPHLSLQASQDDFIDAAIAYLKEGKHEQAIDFAQQAGSPNGDWVVAQSLDELGRLDEANPWWSRIALSPNTSAEGEISYVRSRRLRGEMNLARDRAEQLIDRFSETDDRLQTVLLELAVIQLSTNQQQRARHTAQSVLDHYSQRKLSEHDNAITAYLVLAQAWLALHLFELNPEVSRWEDAARELWESRERFRQSYGPLNVRTLIADLEYGFSLLCLGRPRDAHTHLGTTLEALNSFYPADHYMTMHATFLLAQADSQLRDYDRALRGYRHAYYGLHRTLGPRHPETLAAQYGLGVALILTGHRVEGIRMIWAVTRVAPAAVGLRTDLFGQSLVAGLLLPLLPHSVLRQLSQQSSDVADDLEHRGLDEDLVVDRLATQFLQIFSDPVNHLPWDEGEYVWIVNEWSTEDAVDHQFPDLSENVREGLVDSLNGQSFQWLKLSDLDEIAE